MKRNFDILKEWESIGAGFSAHIGLPLFSVPENYFEHLPNEILSGIHAISAPDIALENYSTPFHLSQDYFETLMPQLMQGVLAAQAKIDQTEIVGISKENLYSVPAHYFDQFANQVLQQINAESSTEEELLDSPLLASLKNANPFESKEMVDIAMPQITKSDDLVPEQAEIEVPMTVRKKWRWSSMVAAASVAVFFFLGAGWLHFRNDNTQVNALSAATEQLSAQDLATKKLAQIPDEAIDNYIAQHADEFNVFMLENSSSSLAGNTDKTVEGALNKVSDAELQEYLDNGVY